MSNRWTLNASAVPAFRSWEGESVVHHYLGNDTHRLAEPAGWILDRLTSVSPTATDELAANSPYDVADLAPALQALGALGLILQC
jgi:hypothetical protein